MTELPIIVSADVPSGQALLMSVDAMKGAYVLHVAPGMKARYSTKELREMERDLRRQTAKIVGLV